MDNGYDPEDFFSPEALDKAEHAGHLFFLNRAIPFDAGLDPSALRMEIHMLRNGEEGLHHDYLSGIDWWINSTGKIVAVIEECGVVLWDRSGSDEIIAELRLEAQACFEVLGIVYHESQTGDHETVLIPNPRPDVTFQHPYIPSSHWIPVAALPRVKAGVAQTRTHHLESDDVKTFAASPAHLFFLHKLIDLPEGDPEGGRTGGRGRFYREPLWTVNGTRDVTWWVSEPFGVVSADDFAPTIAVFEEDHVTLWSVHETAVALERLYWEAGQALAPFGAIHQVKTEYGAALAPSPHLPQLTYCRPPGAEMARLVAILPRS